MSGGGEGEGALGGQPFQRGQYTFVESGCLTTITNWDRGNSEPRNGIFTCSHGMGVRVGFAARGPPAVRQLPAHTIFCGVRSMR